MEHDFRTEILEQTAHRPWKMPDAPWLMTQTWHDLLFAHWPVESEIVRAKLPPAFMLDLFEGQAWLGIVPFRMTNVAPRFVPALPWLSEFPELNVRTYVRVGERPGVYFFSLDAASAIAVQTARTLLNLPYHCASMSVITRNDFVEYRSQRHGHPSAELQATYMADGSVFNAVEGSLEYFLTERYCLYHVDHRGAPYRLEIHHPPWPLQSANARLARNTMASVNGLSLPDTTPLLHFAKRQDMVAWGATTILDE